jgi:hypothetical protein
MENFKKQYRDLQTRVFNELRNKINNSTYKSKFTGDNAIEVDLDGYVELTIIDHTLIFIKENGIYHSIFYSNNNIDLEDLIDILTY